MTLAIETKNLTKSYGPTRAVDLLSLKVEEGEIYAFLGLNGAGKTTTIRMLLGMIKPTSGECEIFRNRIRTGNKKPWKSVGYLVETPHAYPELTVYENLKVSQHMHPGVQTEAISHIIERLNLTAYTGIPAGRLSSGNKQRLGLAKALLHRPRLLILDEPINALDPAGIVEIRQLLLELSGEGVTIFMSSHILAEVANLSHRIGIINHGHLLQEHNVEEMRRLQHKRLILQTREPNTTGQILERAGKKVRFSSDKRQIELSDEESVEKPDEVVTLLVQAGTPPIKLFVHEENLEEYFLRLIHKDQIHRLNQTAKKTQGSV